jgi:hypothetical protein
MIPILLGVVGLAGGAYLVKTKLDKMEYGVLTPSRELVFKSVMSTQQPVERIRALATAFDQCGLRAYAKLLRKKADSAEASPQVKAQRQEAFLKGMSSTNIAGIENLADEFEKAGIPISAAELRKYANGLKEKEKIEVIVSPPPAIPQDNSSQVNGEATNSSPAPLVGGMHGAVNGVATGVDESQNETLEPLRGG